MVIRISEKLGYVIGAGSHEPQNHQGKSRALPVSSGFNQQGEGMQEPPVPVHGQDIVNGPALFLSRFPRAISVITLQDMGLNVFTPCPESSRAGGVPRLQNCGVPICFVATARAARVAGPEEFGGAAVRDREAGEEKLMASCFIPQDRGQAQARSLAALPDFFPPGALALKPSKIRWRVLNFVK